ncbi:MAG: metallophosphoesterase family protein [Lachnospiraceae bacterium]|nr:metallophosphoesterase family protein [Lachnospiraceae bacterium]
MSAGDRLNRAFAHAPVLPLNYCSKYVLVSDCHRGVGTASDNFLKNQHLYFAAMDHYYRNGFTYIELGDGEELWENRKLQNITEIHSDVYDMFAMFEQRNRLYLIYGNHDIVKRKCPGYYEGIILHSQSTPEKSLYLTHGHQASLLNSTLWPLARFLVRYFWNPLENLGILDPTSAAKNYEVKEKYEETLRSWAEENGHILITGHTHRPVLPTEPAYYYNTGSCVHPRCITCIEIARGELTLVKWSMQARMDSVLYVAREVISGPVTLLNSRS